MLLLAFDQNKAKLNPYEQIFPLDTSEFISTVYLPYIVTVWARDMPSLNVHLHVSYNSERRELKGFGEQTLILSLGQQATKLNKDTEELT